MSRVAEPAQPSFPWPWFIALVVCAMGGGVAFGISPQLGIAMAGVTVVVFVCFIVWAVREGRRRRAAGDSPDIPTLQGRLRSHLKWHLPLALLTVVACAVAIATKDDTTPTWVLVAPAALILTGLALLWVLTQFLLPRLQRSQEPTDR